jgi:hypothetical protein
MLYQPGEREHARAFFQTMGFEVTDMPDGPWLMVFGGGNWMYANEPTPAQLNLQAALQQAMDGDAQLADTVDRYLKIRRKHPQYVFHYGASLPTEEDWQARLEALQEANESHPLLKGRLDIHVSVPGMPHALGPLSQAFIYTDILLAGAFPIAPMLFDMQWIPPRVSEREPIDFPDMATMV